MLRGGRRGRTSKTASGSALSSDASDPDRRLRRAEAWRVLRSAGLFVASSPSRWNDPELRGIDPNWGRRSSFDAEDAPGLVTQVFDTVEVDRWSVIAYELPDRESIADYLHAFNIENWQHKANAMHAPLTITKVGADVWAWKQGETHSRT